MSSNSLFVTILSNVSSSHIYTANTIGNFITKLSKKISLQGEWEVSLFAVSYTKSWYNVKDNFEVKVIDTTGRVLGSNHIPEGIYNDEATLVNSINAVLGRMGKPGEKEIFPPPKVLRQSNNGVVTVKPGERDGKFFYQVFGKNLLDLLGMKEAYESFYKNVNRDGKKIKGYSPIDLEIINTPVFVYCDIVYPGLVGNYCTPLLRIVENRHSPVFGEQVSIEYQNPQYLPLVVKEFEAIEIDFKDEFNKTLPFKFGRSIVVLHFRKVHVLQ